jgi:hypothetical protein
MRTRAWWASCYDRTIGAFKRDDIRWLNTVLAVGLVSINLIAFGAAYWLATRDIMAEFTGEVRARGGRDADRVGVLKRSSLSRKVRPMPMEEASYDSFPLPLPHLNRAKPTGTATFSPAPGPRQLADIPLASPNTAPPAEPESLEAAADDPIVSVETGRPAESP